MQPLCVDVMRTARELMDYGVMPEGAEKLVELHTCSRKAGCDHWHQCQSLVERQWQGAGASADPKRAGTR